MFQRIQQYPLLSMHGRVYRPRAYAAPEPDGTWGGWLVFFPLGAGLAISSGRETTQSSFDALVTWATGLTDVYLVGAIQRAEQIAQEPPILATLAREEYEALQDAEQLEIAAEVERRSADIDAAAAASAREAASDIRRERLATEEVVAATEEAAANLEAEGHEEAAKWARSVATDAGRRRRKTSTKTKRLAK
jgi:hypothetical protein